MQRLTASVAGVVETEAQDWRLLRVLVLYRLLLATLLLVLFETGVASQLFTAVNPRWFRAVCNAYAVAAILAALPAIRRVPRMAIQAHLQFGIDAIGVALLVYISGGVSNGVGMLLIPPIMGSAVLLRPRMALLHAACATLALLAEEILRQVNHPFTAGEFTETGILGLMFFATSLAVAAVAERAHRSEALADAAGSEVLSLSRLNERIIQNMLTGVLVVDADLRIRTLNAAAQRMLLSPGARPGQALQQEAPILATRLQQWLAEAQQDDAPLSLRAGASDVIPAFSRLASGDSAPVLILLEDAARLREQAQQLKLAALGRLSASIAHEIRNPLSAISHAGQLLAESETISGEDQRLLTMIQRHATRIDKIIKDVLALSRRDAATPGTLPLKTWLLRNAGLYQEAHAQHPRPLDFSAVAADVTVRFDPNHLQQVVFNLWDNAFEHGARSGRAVSVTLHAGRDEAGAAWLDIGDDGDGVPAESQDHIFEPFFTTAHKGTGLGLYLTRELCEYNQATIRYLPRSVGACFRLTFSNESA